MVIVCLGAVTLLQYPGDIGMLECDVSCIQLTEQEVTVKTIMSSSLPRQITVLALSAIFLSMAACGTLEAGIEQTATVPVAQLLPEDAYTSAQAPVVTATPTPTSAAMEIAATDVQALVESLSEDIDERTLVVFPADYASELKGRTAHRVVPLSIGAGSSATTIDAALAIVLPPSGLVDIVIVNQGAIALAPEVQIALEQRLYRLDRAEMFGALEHHPFAAGPGEPTLEPIGAVFEGGVELVAGGALDDLQPGAPLRLAFDWRVTEPVDDSLVMFAHLVHEDRLVAQWDAVPGNGLLPVESWELGEVVRDQFALELPPELATGRYEVRVGTYSSTSGQRGSPLAPDNGSHVVVGELAVTEGTRTETTRTVTPTPELTDWDIQTWSSSSPDGVWTAETTAAFPIVDGTDADESHY
jgi:hypothetical protein